ncbi:MlaA family lipoprotein [uncultured Sphingomonas sp.]|uniref:MlaA family lipoprotein n=1 Tax=uncultured Sphingomonas sp. TaxID=158754 RepID=UPI0035CB98A3
MTFILWTTATMLAGTPVPQATVPTAATVPPVAGRPDAGDTGPGPTPEPADAATKPNEPVQRDRHDSPQAQASASQNDIIVTARDPAAAPDPLRAINAQSFAATQAVDSAIIGPVSLAYKHTVPSPLRSGVHNFLYNLREPVVLVNFIFQHKIGKAAETVGRFVVNSTIGIAGVIDVAKKRPFRLPRRGNGFADTLGFYGVPPGPFMFLPIVGPTTVRDLFGGFADRLVLPAIVGSHRLTNPAYAVPAAVLGVLDHRAEFDQTLHTLHDNVADPYANSRAFYLQRRQAEIDHLRGRDVGNSSPMSEAPTEPIRVKKLRSPGGTTPVQP